MSHKIHSLSSGARRSFWELSIRQKTLGHVCLILFIGMLIPLVVIALYNYPADDDFGFVLPVATAWVDTGSLPQVFKAIYDKTHSIYMTWQGNFVSTAFFPLMPMVFDMDYYFLSSWFLLALLCLSLAYLLKGMLRSLGCREKSVFWIVYTAVMILVLQFMPSTGEGIFWHNGGMYTVASCTLFVTLGLLIRTGLAQSRGKTIGRAVLLALCGFMLGGSFYGPALAALVLLTLLTLSSFLTKSPNRFYHLPPLAFFLLSLILSVTAPGNALRQERLGQPNSVFGSIIISLLDSFELAGKWLSPQLLAMALLILPTLWKPLKASSFSFRHPLWFLVMLYGSFASTLTPGVYTSFSYDTGRYMNVVYFNFLTTALGSLIYAEGWLIRHLERRQENPFAQKALALFTGWNNRFTALYLVLSIALLTLGGFANTIMNTSSVSALKSLVTGEAARFHAEMKERQEYIRITDSDVVNVRTLSGQPYVFKPDKLPFQGIYGRVRYMKWYFELFYHAQHPQETLPESESGPAP